MELFVLYLFMASVSAQATAPCSSATLDGSRIYILSDVTGTYISASSQCKARGGQVADIRSTAAKNSLLRTAVNKYLPDSQKVYMTRENDLRRKFSTDISSSPLLVFSLYKTKLAGMSDVSFCAASWPLLYGYKWWVTNTATCNEGGWYRDFRLYGGNGSNRVLYEELFNFRSSDFSSNLTFHNKSDNFFTWQWKSIFVPIVPLLLGSPTINGGGKCTQKITVYNAAWRETSKTCTAEAYYACQFDFKVSAHPSACSNAVTVNWTTTYQPSRSTNILILAKQPGMSSPDILITVPFSNMTKMLPNLRSATEYDIQVTLHQGACVSNAVSLKATTYAAAIPLVENATVTRVTPCQIYIPISNDVAGVQGYQVKAIHYNNSDRLQNVTSGNTTLSLDGFPPSSFVRFEVKAIHCKGFGAWTRVKGLEVCKTEPSTTTAVTTTEYSSNSGYPGALRTPVQGGTLPIGIIAGAGSGALLLIIAIVLFAVFWKRRSGKGDRDTSRVKYTKNESGMPDDQIALAPEISSKPLPITANNENSAKATKEAMILPSARETSDGGESEENAYQNTGDYENVTPDAFSLRKQFSRSYFEKCANNFSVFREEFEALASKKAEGNKNSSVAKRIENASRNRYKNIFPYDHARVVLQPNDGNDYINASYIDGSKQKGKFIATQGPKNNTLAHFWQMIWEQKTSVIIMLTGIKEKEKSKCEKYWPDMKAEMQHGPFLVKTTEENQLSGIVQRKMTISMENRKRQVVQFQYTTWPDHGIPVTTSTMMYLRNMVEDIHDKQNPIVVHCSAGAGRTGTYIAMDILFDKLEANEKIDVGKTVIAMRQNRTDMVQSWEQYVFIHKLVVERISLPKTDRSATELQSFSKNELASLTCDEFRQLATWQYSSETNKNGKDGCGYESSSLIQDLGCSKCFVAAALQSGVNEDDFWKLVLAKTPSAIVSLVEIHLEGSVLAHGDIEILLGKKQRYGGYNVIDTTVRNSHQPNSQPHNLSLINLMDWQDIGSPPTTSTMIELIDSSLKANPGQREACVVVCCSNGCTRTGTFIALANILERLKTENRVDVFRTVKDLRDMRQNMVDNEDLYKYCYDVVLDYLSSFDTYANYR